MPGKHKCQYLNQKPDPLTFDLSSVFIFNIVISELHDNIPYLYIGALKHA